MPTMPPIFLGSFFMNDSGGQCVCFGCGLFHPGPSHSQVCAYLASTHCPLSTLRVSLITSVQAVREGGWQS